MPPELLQRPIARVKEGAFNLAERYRPTEVVHHISQVDWAKLRGDGPPLTAFVDMEGVLGEFDALDPEELAVASLRQARAEGHFTHLGIVTNVIPTTRRDFLRTVNFLKRADADDAAVPLGPEDPKPGSRMPFKLMQKYGANPDNTVFVGDQIPDIVAARRAGIKHVIYVNRNGRADHLGVKIARRPIAAPLRMRELLTDERAKPPQSEAGDKWKEILASGWEWQPDLENTVVDAARALEEEHPGILILAQGKIPGYGAPIIELHPDIEAVIPPPWYAKVTEPAKKLAEKSGARKFMWNHGREIADYLSDSRAKEARYVETLIVASEFIPELKPFVRWINIGETLKDLLDGPSAGLDEDGKTAEGGQKDDEADKTYFGAIREGLLIAHGIRALRQYLNEGTIDPLFIIRAACYAGVKARDRAQKEKIRPFFRDEHGFDTSALAIGKASTDLQAWAIATDIKDRHKIAAAILNVAELGLKTFSLAQQPFGWLKKHEKKGYDAFRQDQIEKELRAGLEANQAV